MFALRYFLPARHSGRLYAVICTLALGLLGGVWPKHSPTPLT
jgi:hypothetical protein